MYIVQVSRGMRNWFTPFQLAEVRSRPRSRTSDHRAEISDQANAITRGRTDHL